MKKDFRNYKELFNGLKTKWAEHLPLWQKIAQLVAISVDPQYAQSGNGRASEQLDQYIDDPTAAISVNQAGDYLWGIIWGNGDNAFSLMPSEDVKEMADLLGEDVTRYFEWRTRRLLGRMNDSQAGLASAGKTYSYDQVSFGTSGLGSFLNGGYKDGAEENIFIFRNYGVDGLIIDEGKSGLVDIIFVPYRWTANRIVSEFCVKNGKIDGVAFSKLPGDIQKAYESSYNDEFNIVHGIIPREDYDPKLKGKRGAKYRGIWFTEDVDKPFFEEDYTRIPIGVCRAVRVRGDVYGRASGTMLISAIRSVNYMVGKTIEILEKIGSPSLGLWSGSILGDNVLDTSADGLNVFNPEFRQGEASPVFPLHEVGDPTGIIKFLIPYFNDKISTAFKIDILLDFNDKSSKTATEMLQRAVIRDKALSGMLQQQRDEALNPVVHHCVAIEDELDLSGVNRMTARDLYDQLLKAGKTEKLIPQSVLAAKEAGKPWYQIKWNNALDKLSNAEKLEALVKMLNVIQAVAAVFPDIIEAVDWYKFLEDFKACLSIKASFMLTAEEFKQAIAQKAAMQAQLMALQGAKLGSDIKRNMAGAKRDEAQAVQTQSAPVEGGQQ
jgi:hypothetical protein